MRFDRDAAAVVRDGAGTVGLQFDLDPAGMPCDRLVHRVVQDLGHQVMQRALVGAADIHARPQPDGLHLVERLDCAGAIVLFRLVILEEVAVHGIVLPTRHCSFSHYRRCGPVSATYWVCGGTGREL